MDADALASVVRDKVVDLQTRLVAKVEANLSGDVLQTRSGALKASISTELNAGADMFDVSVSSDGIPYAAIQEYGGHTSAHDIVPVKAKALAFAGAGGRSGGVFARRVHHPGSAIPARAPLGSALDALRGEMSDDLKQAVLHALRSS